MESESRTFPAEGGSHPAVRRFRLDFTGSGGEYFRIWIVNTFLTIVTLGVYAAWAKVRTRRYFYRNIKLAGHALDYLATPAAIFRGYVIIGGFLLAYYITGAYKPALSAVFLVMFFLVFPFLIHKSMRFFAYNSAYRNIRFGFGGTIGESYRTHLLYPLLVPLTLGLIIPYWEYQKRRYFFHNLAVGATKNVFHGRPGPFYKVYALLVLLVFVFGVAFSIFMAGSVQSMQPFVEASAEGGARMDYSFLSRMLVFYMVLMLVTVYVQQQLYAWTTNYCLKHSALGTVRFTSSLKGGALAWIRISNVLAIVFSLGLLTPWAKVRRMRYILKNVTVVAEHGLDDFTASAEREESAYGDAAADFFDFDIAL